jgi:lipoprotein-anchoring transpeptidase ErfK/SrfK
LLAVAGAALWIGSAGAAPLFSSAPEKSDAIMGQPLFNGSRSEPSDLAPNFHRQVVRYPRNFAAGTVIIDTSLTYLYYVLGDGRAIRYGIGVGRDGFTWSGTESITRKAEWPDWIPPKEMIARQPYLARFTAGGEGNPLGARAMYLGNTVYRIHGTNMPETIGKKVSSGCVRMLNADVTDLYGRVNVGTKIIVLPNHQSVAARVSVAPTRYAAQPKHDLSTIY